MNLKEFKSGKNLSEIVNIYCDESCHLEHDRETAMVLGGIWCPKIRTAEINKHIAEIKRKHDLSPFFEIKWGKVSNGKLEFYKSLINLFFDTNDLNFRAWIIPEKSILSHGNFAQTHDEWYYKMYFNMLKVIIRPNEDRIYHIYLDIKDTRSRDKIRKLHEVLANANYDFNRDIIAKIQHVHSHDIGLIQLADLFIGAIAYSSRNLTGSDAKLQLIDIIKQRSNLTLKKNTLPSASKVNICLWVPKESANVF